jgi:hypothetical protein
MTDLEFYKELKIRRDGILKGKKYCDLSLEEFASKSLLFSGQRRSQMWENWFVKNVFERKIPSREDRGDLATGNIYVELKTRVLEDKEITRGVLHKAQQIRIWQELSYYLFLTTNEGTLSVDMYLVPKEDFVSLLTDKKIPVYSSHMVGTDVTDFLNNRVEVGIELNSNKHDFSKYKVTLEQLKEIIKQKQSDCDTLNTAA